MSTKAERTSRHIIESTAPIFNKYGYVGASMSQLTAATGLTKGAIYGNFKNKEALALYAFEHLRNVVLEKLDELLSIEGNAVEKLVNLIEFYRKYDVFTLPLGGCPILNVGIDAQNNNRLMAAACRETISEIEGKIALVLEEGEKANEIRLPLPPLQFAKQLYTMIQGAVAMGTMTRNRKYLADMVAYLQEWIREELEK